MVILEFNRSPVRTFTRGFLKGLGAPFVLYGQFQVAPVAAIPRVTHVDEGTEQSLARDWVAVRKDLMSAISRYEADARRRA